ncbi:hypothetical protein TIFTF001_040513 [Ficus carica]|uniref:Disease resistance N-terminal domain-containing protein n=1 Tax=Ficus carica TaxID=3494 RepID=A0AA87ZCW2_FICCA|nr:hypothetical protein TIFTF001_040511 [Ficus carica]GMN23930.1 hypothetical protein TIFTF001_040513 [Ficus carica]
MADLVAGASSLASSTSYLIGSLLKRLQLANKLLNDSEVKQLKDEDEKKLLDDLKVLAYEADQAMDKINTEALRRKGEDDEQSRIARLTHSATMVGG